MDKFEVYEFLSAHTEALLQLRKEAQAQGMAETGEYIHWLEARVIGRMNAYDIDQEIKLRASDWGCRHALPLTHEEAEALTREADKRAPHA